jgi:hypothetical protein
MEASEINITKTLFVLVSFYAKNSVLKVYLRKGANREILRDLK